MPQIIVKIDKFGDPKISVEGATGTGCVEATASLEAAFAGAGARNLKPEYDEQSAGSNAQEVQQSW